MSDNALLHSRIVTLFSIDVYAEKSKLSPYHVFTNVNEVDEKETAATALLVR